MLNILYTIIIYPLYQIIEFFYSLCDAVVKNPGISVIGVSFAVSFLCLPMYIIAERWQEKERNIQKNMKPRVDQIKAAFKGDERYMMLSTYYRQRHYHPAMALRSSLSLLIQIPFFIAAYKFLSHLEVLQGYSFLFIKDMGVPDATFTIGNFNVNVLPIAMTIINIIAGVIYSKGHPLTEKVQIYLMALFFLVFLYNSPSGLVLYWTLNNVFSLIKNIFYKIKHPLIVLYCLLVVAVLGADYYLMFKHNGFLYRRITLMVVISLLLLIPLVVKGINWILKNPLKNFVNNDKKRTTLFIISSILLALLVGYALPSYMISSSPSEFSFIDNIDSPFYFLRNSLWQSIGFCVFWPCCMYFLFGRRIKSLITIFMISVSLCGVVNAFAFGGDYGLITTALTFTDVGALKPSLGIVLLNFLVLVIVIAIIFVFLAIDKIQFVSYSASIVTVALLFSSIFNSVKISKGYHEVKSLRENNVALNNNELEPIFNLSKTEPNVLVIMEDRAINGHMPYLLDERPELYDVYDGFVYYPNTVSMGHNTISGSPALYGGYEYSPLKLNEADDIPLKDKHNEALKVLPVIFDQNGYTSTVTDMSWANFSWVSDLSIYDDYPNIKRAPNKGKYNTIWMKQHPNDVKLTPQSESLRRNLIWFGLFKTMTPILRDPIYDDGHWWAVRKSTENIKDFLNSYAVLDFLPELTDTSSTTPTFTILVNEATHEPVLTGYPNYDLTTDEIGPYPLDDDISYNSFASTLLRLGEYFDYMKANDVYDNTRIIIVADHGYRTVLDEIEDYPYNLFRPILLVKDFNASGKLTFSDEFMTNADTPYLATKDIIENATNPFTGRVIEETVDKEKVFIAEVNGWSPDKHNKNTLNVSQWYSVHDDIFNLSNWKKEEDPFK